MSITIGGMNQGTVLYQGSGDAIDGEHIYINPFNNQPTPVPMSLPNLSRTLWLYATDWGGATASVWVSPDGENGWVQLADPDGNTDFTSNTAFNSWASGNIYYKTVISGSTVDTDKLTTRLTFG